MSGILVRPVAGALALFLAVGLGACEPASAHARLTYPPPRNNSDGIKMGPCGGLPRGNNPVVWTAGSQVKIEWEETVDHPGRYLLSFSFAGDQGFEQNVLAKDIPDLQGRNNLPHKYWQTIRVPNAPCDSCTLQMIQSMEENPSFPSYYYSCADVRIVAAGATPAPTAAPTASPVASATPGATPGANRPFDEVIYDKKDEIEKPAMTGCTLGMIKTAGRPGGRNGKNSGGPMHPMMIGVLLALPLLFALRLKMSAARAPVRARREKRARRP